MSCHYCTSIHLYVYNPFFLVFLTDSEQKVSGHSTSRPPLPNKFTSKHGLLINTQDKYTNNKENTDELTNQIFGSLMLDKSDQYLAHNCDDLGIVDTAVGKVRWTSVSV